MPENLNNEQQETTPSGNKIYILSRNNYDNWQGSYGNNIFFVRENSADQDKMVSVYVGESKQSNIVVTDENDIWDRTTNDYTIPEKYQVSDKLFLIKRTLATGTEQETPDNTIYGIVTWNGERFIDCGVPNNVIVLTDIEKGISDLGQWLSQNITGIKDFIYIIPNYHSIYYYDGANGYISIISVDSFVTVEMLNEVASRIPVADELTVLSKISNSQTVFSAAGADLSGKMVIVGSDEPVEASSGATIFNNYNPTPVSGKQGYKYGTTAIGAYSSAFGTGNVTRGSNSVAFGSSNTIGASGGNSSVIGATNTVNGAQSLVVGVSSQLSGSQCLSVGISNNIQSGSGCVAFGMQNTFTNSGECGSIGQYNEITAGSSCISLGESNNIHTSSQPPYSDTYTNIYSVVSIGTNNNVSGHSFKEKVNGSLKTCTNFSNIAIGHGNTISETSNGSIVIGGYKTGSTSNIGSEGGNTVKSPRSVVIGSYNTLNATERSTYITRDNFIIGKQNTLGVNGYSASNVHVFGDNNNIATQYHSDTLSDANSTYVIGHDNTTAASGVPDTFIFGYDNECTNGYTLLVGNGLISNRGLVLGQYNEEQTGKYDVLLSCGTGSSSGVKNFDAIGILNTNIIIDPSRKTSMSIHSGYGTSLTMGTQIISSQTETVSGNTLQCSRLPSNNYIAVVNWGTTDEIQFALDSNNKFIYPLPSETILPHLSTSTLTLDQTTDYSCLLVIPKLSSFNSASDIIVNFTANDASKIYLLNPDIDISSYTTIHILLFYDLTNLCAIVSGYQEVTTP